MQRYRSINPSKCCINLKNVIMGIIFFLKPEEKPNSLYG